MSKETDCSTKATLESKLNAEDLRKMLSSSIMAQKATASAISEKLAALRAEIKNTGAENKLSYVTQEDIELGRDTSVLDDFIEDVIANRI